MCDFLSCAPQAEEWSHPERRFADSIESLVRNNIQKMKIDMANEVIDAGRFDMQTTMEERKQTLEAMLQVYNPLLHQNTSEARTHLSQGCCLPNATR
jgi:hypothetical protein